jgi:hypothetical protein
MAGKYYKQLFDAGIWESQVLAKAKSSFAAVAGRSLRCWNCDKENCSMNRCNQPIDKQKCEQNRQKYLKAKGNARTLRNNDRTGADRTGGERRQFPEWRRPESSEDNNRVIFGISYTWDGRKSWMKDQAPASGFPETPPGALNRVGGDATIPTEVIPPSPSSGGGGDDGTVMITKTGFTVEEKNELHRIEANIQNMGTNLSGFGAFLNNLNNKHWHVLGYNQPILGYNSEGWNLVSGSLIECIKDGFRDFFPLLFVYLFWLWNCIDFTFWMTVRVVVHTHSERSILGHRSNHRTKYYR